MWFRHSFNGVFFDLRIRNYQTPKPGKYLTWCQFDWRVDGGPIHINCWDEYFMTCEEVLLLTLLLEYYLEYGVSETISFHLKSSAFSFTFYDWAYKPDMEQVEGPSKDTECLGQTYMMDWVYHIPGLSNKWTGARLSITAVEDTLFDLLTYLRYVTGIVNLDDKNVQYLIKNYLMGNSLERWGWFKFQLQEKAYMPMTIPMVYKEAERPEMPTYSIDELFEMLDEREFPPE